MPFAEFKQRHSADGVSWSFFYSECRLLKQEMERTTHGTIRERIMNNMQNEQLFTNLTSTQAETIAGGDFPIPGGGPLRPSSRADASYGYASATFRRKSPGSFTTWLDIGDKARDGYAVYAIFQGKTNDGRILSLPTQHAHRQGSGTSAFTSFDISFGNVDIRKIWVAICRENPGKDLYVQGDWVYNP